MKNIATVLSLVSLVGVIILAGLYISADKSTKKTSSAGSGHTGDLRLAYVNIDTFNAHYDYLKDKNSEFQKKQTQMEAELQRSAEQFQNAAREFQQKAQSGALSQAEGEATQKRLAQMQQSLQLREQALNEQLLKEKDSFNSLLQKQLDEYLSEYSKDKHFDFILSYSNTLPLILYANKDLDITQEVIKGMNERVKKDGDTSGKK